MIDIQINGAYGFDFSVYDGDDKAYQAGLKNVADRIVETGVTAFASPFSPASPEMLTAKSQSCSYLDRE